MALYKLCVINSTVLLDIIISKFKVLTISNNTLLALRAGNRLSVFDRSVAVLRGRAPGRQGRYSVLRDKQRDTGTQGRDTASS